MKNPLFGRSRSSVFVSTASSVLFVVLLTAAWGHRNGDRSPMAAPALSERCGTQEADAEFALKGAMARPVLSGPEFTLETTRFLIHWTNEGSDSTTAAYVDSVAATAEYSWLVEVDFLGFEAPPGDGAAGGGIGLYDIYVHVYPGAFGACYRESATGNPVQPDEYTSYVSISPNLSDSLVHVTIAHEFKHAIQNGYDGLQPSWWKENCAVWMEEGVYNDNNDYRNYIGSDPGPLRTPERGIDDNSGTAEYGGGLWPMYLSERHGASIIRRTWERSATTAGNNTLTDIDVTLQLYASTKLNDALMEYAIWRCFTGSRALPDGSGYGFDEADSFFVSSSLLESISSVPASGPLAPPAITGTGGCRFVRMSQPAGYSHIVGEFQGDNYRDDWRVALAGVPAAGPLTVEHMAITSNIMIPQSGLAAISGTGHSAVFIVSVFTDREAPLDTSANFSYTMRDFQVVPFTDGSPPLYGSNAGSSPPINLPFTFCLYDSMHSQVYVNVDGTLSFGGPQNVPTPPAFPFADTTAVVAPFWTDASTIDFAAPSRIGAVYSRITNNSVTIIWDRVTIPAFPSPDSTNTFAAIITDGTDSTIGIGNTVGFRYWAMQCYPSEPPALKDEQDASPAIVGANAGDNQDYDLIGTFGPGGGYFGGTSVVSGVKYLERRGFAWNGCAGMARIVGRAYRDDNQNCEWNIGEPVTAGKTIFLSPTGAHAKTGADGRFQFGFLSPMEYRLWQPSLSGWTQTCPIGNGQIVVTLDSSEVDTSSRFGNYTQLICDLSVFGSGGRARPGRPKTIYLTVKNLGNVTTDGVLDFISPLAINATRPAGTLMGTDTVIWTLPALTEGASLSYEVDVTVPTNAVIDDLLVGVVRVTTSVTDQNPSNNQRNEVERVTNSADPNLKQVYPLGLGADGRIKSTDTLVYQIHFQNVGNDTAFDIVIRDTLDVELDMSTLIPGTSSHPHTFQFGGGRELIWQFNNINLPDSTTDEPRSHGFVSYQLLIESGAANGTPIENRAQIYFDFNAPLATNTVLNTIDNCLDICLCHADPACDGVRSDVVDVVNTIDVAFRGVAAIVDPDCAFERTDVDCDGVTNILDVVNVVDVAFRGEDPSTTYCDGCI